MPAGGIGIQTPTDSTYLPPSAKAKNAQVRRKKLILRRDLPTSAYSVLMFLAPWPSHRARSNRRPTSG